MFQSQALRLQPTRVCAICLRTPYGHSSSGKSIEIGPVPLHSCRSLPPIQSLWSITMQSSKLLIFSCFALAATVGASTSVPPVLTPSISFTPLPPCTLGGNAACGTGSVCTPITNCIGQCYSGISSPTVLPTSNIPVTATGATCQVGFPSNQNGCSSGSYCLPTQTCAGLCLNTVPLPPATTTTPPTSILTPSSRYGCVVDEYDITAGCATSSFCTPVGQCNGLCTTTTAPYGIGAECMVLDGDDCGPNAFCSQSAGCEGTCTAFPITSTHTSPTTTPKTTPKSTSTQSSPSPSGTCGWVYIPCKSGYKCVNQQGANCGVGEAGHCVPDHQGKRRYLAGRYFDAAEE